MKPQIRYIRRNFDEAAILAVATKLAFEENPQFNETEKATLAAMQRAHPQAGVTTEELGQWLGEMGPEQITGVVSNTKGVLHEMEFVRLENEDGDAVHAALFDEANHEGYDVFFLDAETGVEWEAQLKATESASYVQDWIEAHPDGEIIVTDEIANLMGVEASGLSNADLTLRTEDVVDRLLEADRDDTIWDYFPSLAIASIGLVVWELWQRLRKGEISMSRFKWLVAKATGLRTGKVALLSLAMSVPGLNVVTGATLATRLILRGLGVGDSSVMRTPISSLTSRFSSPARNSR